MKPRALEDLLEYMSRDLGTLPWMLENNARGEPADRALARAWRRCPKPSVLWRVVCTLSWTERWKCAYENATCHPWLDVQRRVSDAVEKRAGCGYRAQPSIAEIRLCCTTPPTMNELEDAICRYRAMRKR